MNTTIAGQTVIVTGGVSGLGYAIVEQFLAGGANVVLNWRTQAKLAQAAEQLGHCDRVAIVAGDITQPATASRADNPPELRLVRLLLWRYTFLEVSGACIAPGGK